MGSGDTFLNAVVGAVVTVLASFVPFSPVVGGAVAGYLQEGDTASAMRVGALSGLIATIPFALVLALLGSVLSALPLVGVPLSVSALFGTFFFVVLLVALVYTVALSTLGGYVGWHIQSETDL
jgi:hypothetical protein